MWRGLAVFFLLVSPTVAQEPTVRELRAIMDERDQRYGERFTSQEKAVAAALAAAKEAVAKAENASEKRFEGVNEFRNTLKDQQATLITRVEVEARIKALFDKVEDIATRQNQVGSRLEAFSWLWGLIVGAGGLFLTLATIYLGYYRRAPAAK